MTEEWVFIPLDDRKNILRAVRKGHGHPFITVKDGSHCLALTKCDRDPAHTAQEVIHVIEHYETKADVCILHVVFETDCISKLRKLPDEGMVCNKKVCEQRELAGIFTLKEMRDGGVCAFDIDHSTVIAGKKEAVDVPRAMYTFHTHPRQAYQRHGVKKGWPSVHDFVGVLTFGKEMIFHAVCTIEGLYIISLCPLSKLPPIEFVDKNFDFSHHAKYDEYEYTRRVERVKYNGHQVFNIKYIPWDHCHSIIAIPYAKHEGVCSPVPETREKAKALKGVS